MRDVSGPFFALLRGVGDGKSLSLSLISLLGLVVGVGLTSGIPSAHARSSMASEWNQSLEWEHAQRAPERETHEAFVSSENLFAAEPQSTPLHTTLSDPQNRVASEFDVPASIRPRVSFWLRVYTEWTTHHAVLFDRYHPEVIYDVMDFRELAATARTPVVYEILRERRVERRLKEIRTELKALHSKRGDNPLRRQLRKTVSVLPHHHSAKELAEHLRSQTGQRDNIIRGIVAAKPFMSHMEQIFEQEGLPKELIRISLVESSFQPSAVSKAGAAGVWQFMLASAREYMTVDPRVSIDERLSPIKSTYAAAKLLKRSHRIFKSWPLAVTSYNHGMTAIKSRRGKDNARFESISYLFTRCERNKRGLGWASQNYYAEFLALVYADAYQDQFYGQAPDLDQMAVRMDTLRKPQSAVSYAVERGISLSEFQRLNPDVGDIRKTLPKRFRVLIPDHIGTAQISDSQSKSRGES